MSGQIPIRNKKSFNLRTSKNTNNYVNKPVHHESFSSNDSDMKSYSYVDNSFLQHNPSTSSSNKSNEVVKLERKSLDKERKKKKKNLRSRKPSLENQLTLLSDIVQKSPDENVINNVNELYNTELTQGHTSKKLASNHNIYKNVDMFENYNNKNFENAKKSSVLSELQTEVVSLKKQSSQMKATIKWWSEKSNNWKNKWSVVKHECKLLNKEIQRISNSETELFNQLEVFKQQRQLLIQENKRLRSIMNDKKLSIHESDTSSAYSNDISVNRDATVSKSSNQEFDKVLESEMLQKNSALQLKVDESSKTIQAERDAKLSLNKTIESLENELSDLKNKFQEVKTTKQETLKQMARAQESHRCEIVRMNENLEEESKGRTQLERKLQELREEIEQLQNENTLEWGKRERLESEKLQLERENKRLKSTNEEMKVAMGRKSKMAGEDRSNELKQAQAQLNEFSKELMDLRRQSNRDRKQLQERSEEVQHHRRRSDQHEQEVRGLRGRVEEMKKMQATTEDENDNLQNQNRRFQRLIEEKEEENEELQLQYNQLQARVRNESRSKSSYLRSNVSSTTSESDG